MVDREKVINDLQDAVNDDWMWQHADYYAKAMENALALLKEQEARVMTLEEVKKHNNKNNCVWFELRNIVIIPVFVSQARQETIIENRCILSDQTIPHLYWKNIDYRKKWRCWNTKPTDEQRNAVKWDDSRIDKP